MLNLGTIGGDGAMHSFVIRVDNRTQADLARFVTSRVQDRLRNRLCGLAHATRGINLQEVGPSLFLFTDKDPAFPRRSGLLAAAHERLDDRHDPWRREPASSNRLAKCYNAVHALDRGEAAEQRCVSICGSAICGFWCGDAHARVLAVGSEARRDVHMLIDPTWHHRQTA